MAALHPLTPQQNGIIAGVLLLLLTLCGCVYVQFVMAKPGEVLPTSDLPTFATGVVSELGTNGVFYRIKPYMAKVDQLGPVAAPAAVEIGKQDLSQPGR
jgi:hypothetical protein